jgi:hypothetical protein
MVSDGVGGSAGLRQPCRQKARAATRAFELSGLVIVAEPAQPDRMATLGKEPVRIDILSSISGVSFSEAWRGRVTVSLDGEELHFLGLAAMKKPKRAAGRTKDLLDLALLNELDEPTQRKASALGAKSTAKKAAPRKET